MYQNEIFPARDIALSLRQQLLDNLLPVSVMVNNMGEIIPSLSPLNEAVESCFEMANEAWILMEPESLSLANPLLLTLTAQESVAYWLCITLDPQNPLYSVIRQLGLEHSLNHS